MQPAFVVPVFVDVQRSNSLYVQEIAQKDRIVRFDPIDVECHDIYQAEAVTAKSEGDLALWAFQFEDGRCLVGEREALRPALEAVQGSVPPLLRLQISALLTEKLPPDLAAAAYQSIEAIAPKSAVLWRDLIVLLPAIRHTLSAAQTPVTAAYRSSLADIELHIVDAELRVTAPAFLIETVGGEREFVSSLAPLQQLLAALGIERVEVQRSRREILPDLDSPSRPRSGVAMIHCAVGGPSNELTKLRDVSHLPLDTLIDARGQVLTSGLPRSSDVVLLIVENQPDAITAAAKLSTALANDKSPVGALVVPAADRRSSSSSNEIERASIEHFEAIRRSTNWLAFAGVEPYRTIQNPGEEPITFAWHSHGHVARWVPHAIRACAQAGKAGRNALNVLHARASEVVSVTTARAQGPDAIERATKAALAASKSSVCPSITAQDLVLVAFHNRSPDAQSRQQVRNVALEWNPHANVTIVEEVRADMTKRVRIVAFARGRRDPLPSGRYIPPHLEPLAATGWRLSRGVGEAQESGAISKGRVEYSLRIESDIVLDLESAEELAQSTLMYRGEVALLVKAIADVRAKERLLSGGIFPVPIDQPEMLDAYGDAPGAAIHSAWAALDRAEICERASIYIRDCALTGLWSLSGHWAYYGDGIYARWRAGIYARTPALEELQLYRVAGDGTHYFRGIVRLDSSDEKVPRLRYQFGAAVDKFGARVTRMKPVPGEYDVRAEIRARLEAYWAMTATVRQAPLVRERASSPRQLSLPEFGRDDRSAE